MNIFLTSFGEIFAAPALHSLFEITQPNGAKIRAYLRGDEYFSWWESERGTVLFRNLDSGYFEHAKISKIDNVEKLVSTGDIFVAGEETSLSNSRFSKKKKLNLYKIWMQKREKARKSLQEILEKQKNTENQ